MTRAEREPGAPSGRLRFPSNRHRLILCTGQEPKRDLVDMVAQNAREGMAERHKEREQELAATEGAMRELQAELGLAQLPYRIECFDI